ncbi:hypothetical protein HQQ80_03745 [Microbacteriaceae bacterium VKM Ac-2855]|nr:hypothetical protein [Microbacteriaceae bacterium VKM Ac-2855]
MTSVIGRWSRDAVLARLCAFNAIDSVGSGPADRARRKIDALRTIAALDAGEIDAEEAIIRFGAIAADAVLVPA